MSPLTAILHIAGAVVGVWAGFALMGAIGAPEGTGAADRGAQEGERAAEVERQIDEAARAVEAAQEARDDARVEACMAGVRRASGLPRRARRAFVRGCERSPISPRGICARAVAEAVDPASPAWTRANSACAQIED